MFNGADIAVKLDVLCKTDEEKKFFDLLQKTKRAIYDWGYGCIFVLENPTNTNNYLTMNDIIFIERTGARVVTSADMVCILLASGIDVQIHDYDKTFPSKEDFDTWRHKTFGEEAHRVTSFH